jgi:hypothetical protein
VGTEEKEKPVMNLGIKEDKKTRMPSVVKSVEKKSRE